MQQAVQRSWGYYAKLDFTGWGTCPATNSGDTLRISIGDSQPLAMALGRPAATFNPGLNLNFTYQAWSPGCSTSASRRQSCIEFDAMHEFGHALGFAHEHNRPDTPTDRCIDAPQGTNGDVKVGEWDQNSVMNYCNFALSVGGVPTSLGATDIEMVQKFYGARIGLSAAYFDNSELQGEPKLVRTDGAVFNWQDGAPAPELPADNFSVRWTGFIDAPTAGTYTLETWSDDGVRVWVDGQMVINNWTAHSASIDRSAPLKWTAGRHAITVEYQEIAGLSMMQLRWRQPGEAFSDYVPQERLSPARSGSGLAGAYFNNPTLQGVPVATRSEPVNYQWAAAPAGVAVPADGFSVRWNGWVEPPVSGTYALQTVSDDGVRVWVDGQLVIDNWTGHAPTANTAAAVRWEAGQLHAIRVEYQELGGPGTAQLRWQMPGEPAFTVVPVSNLYPAPIGTGSGTGLSGAYFATPELEGAAVARRTEAVNFDWTGSPATGVPADGFSVRWSGTIEAATTGLHALQTVSDDGIRVWIDGQPVINNWTGHAAFTDTAPAQNWQAGERHAVTIEYQEIGGPGRAQLRWSTPQHAEFRVVPTGQLHPQ